MDPDNEQEPDRDDYPIVPILGILAVVVIIMFAMSFCAAS